MTRQEKREERLAKLRELVAEQPGLSVNKVAEALGVAWADAKRLLGEVNAPEEKRSAKKQELKNQPAEPEEPECFDVMLQVPTGRLDEIFQAFTAQEKANAIAGVLQERMDAALGA